MEKRFSKTPALKMRKLREKSWGTITVFSDNQVDNWLEPMPAGTESCPNWYSVRLFKGTETSPGKGKQPEYWLGICNVALFPILPIPFISDEIVVKLGDNLDYYNKLKNETGSHFAHVLMRNRDKYFKKIINKATVQFTNCDITYNNDEIWSV